MKYRFLALSLILASSFSIVNAQEKEDKKSSNIYIGAGIGAMSVFNDGMNSPTFNMNVKVGKYITPVWGVRAEIAGAWQSLEKQEYTGEFKLNVLNYMKTTGASYSATVDYFGISDIGTIANWKAKVLKDGVEALFRLKGRPRKNMTKLNSSKETKGLTREQHLEEENKLLIIEIEYLKMCHAHGIAPWSQKIKSKQESSKSSVQRPKISKMDAVANTKASTEVA